MVDLLTIGPLELLYCVIRRESAGIFSNLLEQKTKLLVDYHRHPDEVKRHTIKSHSIVCTERDRIPGLCRMQVVEYN